MEDENERSIKTYGDLSGINRESKMWSRRAADCRRFTFKLEFGFLTEDGKRTFFRRMFAPLAVGELTPADERRLLDIPDLTPGDFRTVRQ